MAGHIAPAELFFKFFIGSGLAFYEVVVVSLVPVVQVIILSMDFRHAGAIHKLRLA